MISIPEALEHKIEKLLTPSEQNIVRDVAAGKSNALIASLRGISPKTVANQLASIYRKLNLTSRQELLAMMSVDSTTGAARTDVPSHGERNGRAKS